MKQNLGEQLTLATEIAGVLLLSAAGAVVFGWAGWLTVVGVWLLWSVYAPAWRER